MAAGVTHGHVVVTGAKKDHLGAFLDVVDGIGVAVTANGDDLDVDASGADLKPLRSADIETRPYPGLATDLQPLGSRAGGLI